MSRLDEIAPRLARAHRAEKLYQERKRHQRQYGYISLEISSEEMTRAMRTMLKAMRVRQTAHDPTHGGPDDQ